MPFSGRQGNVGPLLKQRGGIRSQESADGFRIEADGAERLDKRRIDATRCLAAHVGKGRSAVEAE